MCIAPMMVKNTNNVRKYSFHAVPCGKCYECRMNRGAGWAFRLLQEEKQHACSSFVTLTYMDDKLSEVDGLPTLVKSDLQNYFKRLRFNTKAKLKYYACGEYGSRTLRPHYHAILFGVSDTKAICDNWPDGSVRVDAVSAASISYVCGYVNKPAHKFTDGRQREFSLMSKRLGASYLTPEMIAYHKANMASFVTLEGGIKKALPRYYRDKIFDSAEKDILRGQHELKYELSLLEKEFLESKSPGTFHQLERDEVEAVKAAIRKQNYNLRTKRNKL